MEKYNNYKNFQVSVEKKVGQIVFADETLDNYITITMIEELMDILDKFEQDNEVRCVFFTHAGRDLSHSAGPGEMDYAKAHGITVEEAGNHFNKVGSELFARIIHYSKPTVAAAKGVAMGAGAAIFECFDVRLAGESLHYSDMDLYYGAAAVWGLSTTYLPLWIGRNKLLEFLYFGEDFTARQLQELGMVSRVYSDDVLQPAARVIAEKVATSAPLVVKGFKERINDVMYGDNIPEWHRKELEMAERVNASEDARIALERAQKLTPEEAMFGPLPKFLGR